MGTYGGTREIIQMMVARIADGFQPRRIILYGSHARGEAGPFSDVDLLVLFDELDNPRQKSLDLYQALSGCGLPKDIVVSTASQFERYILAGRAGGPGGL